MERFLVKSLLIGMGLVLGTSQFAFAVSSNGGEINTNMNNRVDSIIDSTTIDGWHSSSGYWAFNYNDWTENFKVNDAQVANYFTGTHKRFEYNLSIERGLPQSVKDFIRVYGKDKVGIRFNVGNNGSILNNSIGYTLSDTSISLSFRPMLKYDRHNMWEYNNSNVWRSMYRQVHTPQVTSGYGENYVSVRGGAIGMQMTPSIMRSAYKASNGTLKFSSNEPAILGDDLNTPTTIASNEVASSNFFGGGSSGVYFRYPITIEFFDLNVDSKMNILNNEYTDGNTYWVKSGDQFNVKVEGTASNQDNLVKVNSNHLRVLPGGAWIDSKTTYNKNTVDHWNNKSGEIKLNGGIGVRENTRLTSDFDLTLDGDKDIELQGISRLVHYSDDLLNNEKVYREDPTNSNIVVKSDSNAPEISGNTDYGWSRNDVEISMSAKDTRSGVGKLELIDINNNVIVSSSNNTLKHTITQDGITSYILKATDNVGNISEKTITVKIDRNSPIISGNTDYPWSKDAVEISLSGVDNESGMDKIELLDSNNNVIATGKDTLTYIARNEGITEYIIRAKDMVGNLTENRVTVRIDKTAPTGDVKYDFNEEDISINVKVDNVVEIGSGVKDIWVEYSPKEDPSIVIKESLIQNPDGSYEITTDLFDKLGSSNTVNVTAKAEDNVGNVGVLGNHEVDMFKITARIERVLAPHNPEFKAGEKGILKIKLYGGVDKYKITFPKEFSTLDSTLNTEVNITPQKVTEISYEFFIPLEAKGGNFNVTVEGFKNGEKKIAKPTFKVTGSITDNLRTRVRVPERN